LESFGIEKEVREGGGSTKRGGHRQRGGAPTERGGADRAKRGSSRKRMAVVPRWGVPKKDDTAGAL
jgi:hypothetical protein